MKIVACIDSFKGSLTSQQAGEAVREATAGLPIHADVEVIPVADGGEGTVHALCAATGGRVLRTTVTGPLGYAVDAEYGILDATKTAVIEMASAAGLPLVPEPLRDPMSTTTYGVGELILHVIRTHGCRRFVIGIGGSATNDGGTGMLSALGVAFLRADGTPIARCGRGLGELATICTEGLAPELAGCQFRIACDVTNPLTGPNGCSAVYAPQKGADAKTVALMDAWLARYADLTRTVCPAANAAAPGAGAAGGMGFAFCAYLGGQLLPGVELILDAAGLDEQIKTADLVITGEGRMDGQSCMGKAPMGVAARAKRHGKSVIALAGGLTRDADALNGYGIDAMFSIVQGPCTLQEAMDPNTAYANLRATAAQALRLWLCGRGDTL